MRRPTPVQADEAMQQELVRLIHRASAQQRLVFRAHIILAAIQGLDNRSIARKFGIHVCSASKWRQRWIATQHIPLSELPLEARLEDAPRPGTPAKIGAEAYCQIMALACQPPENLGRPMTHWTPRELADEAILQGIVATISPRQVGRFLKRSGTQATSEPVLADLGARS